MDNFSQIISWHPGFYVANPAEGRLVLAGETESFLLQGGQYQDLYLRIDGARSILEIISQINGIGSQAALLNTIDELVRKGLLIKKTGHENNIVYYRPDFDSEPAVSKLNGGLLELRVLSKFDEPDFLVQWAQQLNIAKPAGIVFTDDYLDPRISDINRRYMREKRPWLLIKPTGRRPLIGPYFMPEKPNSPCWQCLSYRLLYNQPVRRWLQTIQNRGTIRVPVCCDKKTVKRVASAALKKARNFIDRQIGDCLQEIDPVHLSFADHPVSLLPQCSCCGDPGVFAQYGRKPVALKKCPKIYTVDGGVRSLHPSQTIERLRRSISPVTGIVGDLSLLPDPKGNGVPIFRTFFFKTPGFRHKPENNDFMQISLGKGMSEEQSKAGALCESVERHAAQYRGDEPQVLSPANGSDFRAILPHELASFSEKQYGKFGDPLHPDSRAGHAVRKYREDVPQHWTPAWSLSDGKSYHIPFNYCYANTPFEDERFSRFNSNGCAAGNTLEEALLQGFLELVERDATAIWWYNKIIRPPVSFEMLPEENIRLLSRTLDDEWDYWVLDITHDFNIPVMVAVSRHKENKTFRLGFGCHINPVLACQRSLAELCQLIAIKDRGPAVFDFDHIMEEPFLLPKENAPERKLSDFTAAVHADIGEDVLYCVNRAGKLGLKTLAIDYTRPDIPIHTARVVVPGLCHIWPQFGNRRLYKVPVDMQWRKAERSEDRLNRLALLI